MCSDESPPSQNRYSAYRFQITMLFTPVWRDESTWESSRTPPLDVEQNMADICHCPWKDGASVMTVIDKQVMRFGCSRYDVLSLTGDGGGENEGQTGIHATLEDTVPGYVRRRCHGHVAWRIADACLAQMPEHDDMKRFAEHLHDGITWQRLQAIATSTSAEGGLALFPAMSLEHSRVFGKVPPSIVQGRPETDMKFYTWMRGKEHILYMVCKHDLTQRSLAKSVETAIDKMVDLQLRVARSVCGELLHRALYLHRWVNKHKHVARETTLAALAEKAQALIQGTSLTDDVLERFDCPRETLSARGWAPRTWIELAAFLVYDDDDLARDAVTPALELHARLAAVAGSHLALTIENISRSSWLAAEMLSSDAAHAQHAARLLRRHLSTLAPERLSAFEKSIVANDTHMANLSAFADATLPVCLWQGRGAYKPLFRFLALRFLLAPDEVLCCERIHARWQWWLARRKALQLKNLNASLKCLTYLETHGQTFPAPHFLEPILDAESRSLRAAWADAADRDDIAPVFQRNYPFLDRFNLQLSELRLLGSVGTGSTTLSNSYLETCRVHWQKTYAPLAFYQILGLSDIFIFVMENKTLAGRERRLADDAQHRPLVLCFFERAPGPPDEIIVRRVDKTTSGLKPTMMTIAELLLHLGYQLPDDPGRSAAQAEHALTDAMFTLTHLRFAYELVPGAPDPLTYKLMELGDVEDVSWEATPLAEKTSIAIVRELERRYGWDRRALFTRNLMKPVLLGALDTGILDMGLAGGRGGRGGGRGGRGRGRGPGNGRGLQRPWHPSREARNKGP